MVALINRRFADGIGLFNTVLCMLHCLAMPLLVAVGAGFLRHPLAAPVFALVALLAVWGATRGGTPRSIGLLLWSAALVFALSIVLEHRWHVLHDAGLFASALLLLGHVLNFRWRSRQRGVCTHVHPQ